MQLAKFLCGASLLASSVVGYPIPVEPISAAYAIAPSAAAAWATTGIALNSHAKDEGKHMGAKIGDSIRNGASYVTGGKVEPAAPRPPYAACPDCPSVFCFSCHTNYPNEHPNAQWNPGGINSKIPASDHNVHPLHQQLKDQEAAKAKKEAESGAKGKQGILARLRGKTPEHDLEAGFGPGPGPKQQSTAIPKQNSASAPKQNAIASGSGSTPSPQWTDRYKPKQVAETSALHPPPKSVLQPPPKARLKDSPKQPLQPPPKSALQPPPKATSKESLKQPLQPPPKSALQPPPKATAKESPNTPPQPPPRSSLRPSPYTSSKEAPKAAVQPPPKASTKSSLASIPERTSSLHDAVKGKAEGSLTAHKEVTKPPQKAESHKPEAGPKATGSVKEAPKKVSPGKPKMVDASTQTDEHIQPKTASPPKAASHHNEASTSKTAGTPKKVAAPKTAAAPKIAAAPKTASAPKAAAAPKPGLRQKVSALVHGNKQASAQPPAEKPKSGGVMNKILHPSSSSKPKVDKGKQKEVTPPKAAAPKASTPRAATPKAAQPKANTQSTTQKLKDKVTSMLKPSAGKVPGSSQDQVKANKLKKPAPKHK
jgi:hypothetical protein